MQLGHDKLTTVSMVTNTAVILDFVFLIFCLKLRNNQNNIVNYEFFLSFLFKTQKFESKSGFLSIDTMTLSMLTSRN